MSFPFFIFLGTLSNGMLKLHSWSEICSYFQPHSLSSENYENKHGKALRAIYAARNLAHGVIGPDIPPTVLFKIFDTQIQPIIDYGGEIFYDHKPKRRLESLQYTYLKRALGVKAQTSNLAILGETGRQPFIARQEKLVLR